MLGGGDSLIEWREAGASLGVGVEGPADSRGAGDAGGDSLPSFKRTASKPVMEQVVEDVEATPKDVRQFMKQAVKRDPPVTSPEEDGWPWLQARPPRPWGRQPVNPFSPSGRRALSPLRRGPGLGAELSRGRRRFSFLCVYPCRRRPSH